MQQLITILHILVAVALIALILVQHGKGADVGAAFGSGASNTMFGSVGTTPFLVKITAILAFVFFVTCATLTFLASKQIKDSAILAAPITMPSNIPVPQSKNPALPPFKLPAAPN